MKQLDFIVVGAQKAGTTSLFQYLKPHPELTLPLDKEAPYFSHDPVIARGWDRYLETNFAGVDPATKLGTITTHYMAGGVYDPGSTDPAIAGSYDERTVPVRIHEQLPDVRLIAILRDPVDRAVSHHQMTLMNGLERRSFDEAVADLLRPASLQSSRKRLEEATSYVTRGEYGRILSGFFDVFPAGQIQVMFMDELTLDPHAFLRRVHGFIGVDRDVIPDNLGKRFREGADSRRISWMNPDTFQRAVAGNRIVRGAWRALPESTRRRIDQEFSQARLRIDLWNRKRSGAEVAGPAPETVERLRDHYREDAARLESQLGNQPPWLDEWAKR